MVHAAPPNAAPTEPPEDLLLFTPVPTPSRVTGWTSDKQIAFIESLRRTGVIAKAARSVGMSASAAYQLRKRAGAEGFARAWDCALEEAQCRAVDAVMGMGFEPQREAVWYRGRQVGTRLRRNERLLFAALRGLDGINGRFVAAGHRVHDHFPEDAPGNEVTSERNEIAHPP